MFCSKYDVDKNSSYMDGIPVKISEQYKPPKKISVPSGILNRQKMEIEEYDFRLEKSMVKKMDEWRELRKLSAERRRQRLEMEDQCGNGESKNVGVTDALSALTMQGSEPNGIQQPQQSAQPSVTVPVSQQELPQCSSYHIKGGESGVQGVHSHSDPILTPVPVKSHIPYNHQTVLKKSFNISDFESDTSSPFDNMELKTLNDIEELAHVLQPNLNSSNCDISCPSSSQPPQQDVSVRLTAHLTSNEPSLSSSSVSKKTDDTYPPRINGMNSLHYSNYNILNSSHLWPQYNLLHHHNNHSHNHNHHSYLGARNTWAQSILPASYNPNIQSYVVQRLDHLETDHQPQQQSHPLQHHQPMMSTVVAGTASKSVPDIIQELALELKDKRALEKERTKKILSHPTRPASIGPTEDELEKKSSLSNPLNQLSPSCQQLTLRLTEMGFPLPRVARTVQRFGDNETKVLEFLLQVQHLEEGGCPPDRAEMALVANKYNLSETIRYLEVLKQLLDLGFVEKKVVEALEEHSNDRDKALESLIS